MYMSIRKYKTDPSHIEEIIKRVQEGFTPILRKTPGFYAYYAVDAGDGVALSISIFEDEAGAKASNHTAANWVKANLAPLFPNRPESTLGDVRVHKVA